MKTAVFNITVTDQTYWEETFQFFEDKARTKPLDLSEKEVTVQFSAGPELTEGSGITVTPLEGKVVITTLITTQLNGEYRLNISTEGRPQTPVWGTFKVRTLREA